MSGNSIPSKFAPKTQIANRQKSTQPTNIISPFQQIAKMLFNMHHYYKIVTQQISLSSEELKIFSGEQRLIEITTINDCIMAFEETTQSLKENQKIDLFEEALLVIKQQHECLEESRLTQKSKNKSQMIDEICILEESTIFKLTSIVLRFLIPNFITKNNIELMTQKLIKTFMSKDIFEEEGSKRSQKSTKMKPIYETLLSGKKIMVQWFLLFRITQTVLEGRALKKVGKDVKMEENLEEEEQSSIFQIQKVSHDIEKCRHLIKVVLLAIFNLRNKQVTETFLSSIVSNVQQYELSVLPLFLQEFCQFMSAQFTAKYKTYSNCSKIGDEKQLDKESFNLNNLSIILSISEQFQDSQLFSLEALRSHHTSMEIICSFCGMAKDRNEEGFDCLKLALSQEIMITICSSCSLNIGLDSGLLIALAPIIISKHWRNSFSIHNYSHLTTSLKKIIIYHLAGSCLSQNISKKKKKTHLAQRNQQQIVNCILPDKIAMNNNEQRQSMEFVQKCYRTFLEAHSQLSIRRIIDSLTSILVIYFNSGYDSIRLKAYQLLNCNFIGHYILTRKYQEPEKNRRITIEDLLLDRLKDKSSSIRLQILQYLSSILFENLIPPNKLKLIEQIFLALNQYKKDFQYVNKAISYINHKIIIPILSQGSKSEQIAFRFKFTLACFKGIIRMFETNNFFAETSAMIQLLRQQIYKIIQCLLVFFQQVCSCEVEQSERKQLIRMFNDSLNGRWRCAQEASLDELYLQIVRVFLRQCNLSFEFISSIPVIPLSLINEIVDDSVSQQGMFNQNFEVENLEKIVTISTPETLNLLNQFHLLTSIQMYQPKINHIHKRLPQPLSSYLFSTQFLLTLFSKDQQGTQLQTYSSHAKFRILNRILWISNCNSLLKNEDLIYKIYIHKTQRIIKSTYQLFQTVLLNQKLEDLMIKTFNSLKAKARICDIVQVKELGNTLVHLSFQIGKKLIIRQEIVLFQAYFNSFWSKLCTIQVLLNLNLSQSEYEYASQINALYGNLTRILCFSTSLVTSIEQYNIFNSRLKNYSQMIKNENSNKMKRDKWAEVVLQSELKENELLPSSMLVTSYKQVVQMIEKNVSLNDELKEWQLMLNGLLKCYWDLHPHLIITEKDLLQSLVLRFKAIQFSFIYQSLLANLPSSSIKVLSFIEDIYRMAFAKSIEDQAFCEHDTLISTSYQVMEQLLRCGTLGLYQFSKYVIFGITTELPSLNEVCSRIIRQIYMHEGMQHFIFHNFTDSLQWIYTRNSSRIQNSFREFSTAFKSQISHFYEITSTKLSSKVLLLREKKEMRIEPTFLKRIGSILSNQTNLMIKNSGFLYFLLQIIKSIKSPNYFEICELIFSLEKILQESWSYIIQKWNEEDQLQKMVFRQILCTLCKLTQSTSISGAINNYEMQIQNSSSMWIVLADFELNSATSHESPIETFREEIEAMENILGIHLEWKQQSDLSSHYEDSTQDDQQIQTKPKNAQQVNLNKREPAWKKTKGKQINNNKSQEMKKSQTQIQKENRYNLRRTKIKA